MANTVCSAALLYVKAGRNVLERVYKLTFTNNNYISPVPIDFTAAANPGAQPAAQAWTPGSVIGYSVKNLPIGYTAELIVGSGLNNWGIKLASLASGGELAGAMPATLYNASDFLVSIEVKTNKSV